MLVVNISGCFHMVNHVRLFLSELIEEGSFMSLFASVLTFFGGGGKHRYHIK